MEVAVAEEKKKIFRAKKTMKMSDRLQLESLHNTLLAPSPGLSNPSPPPLINGTHKEDGPKVGEKEQNNNSNTNSPRATSPATPTSLSSPAPFLSLNLSPSPPSSQSPKPQEDTSPTSPSHPEFLDQTKTNQEESQCYSPSPLTQPTSPSVASKEEKNDAAKGEKEENQTNTNETIPDSPKIPVQAAESDTSEGIKPMDAESDSANTIDSEDATSSIEDQKPSYPKVTASSSSTSSSKSSPTSPTDKKQTTEVAHNEIKDEDDKEDVKTELNHTEKMEVDSIKVLPKKEKSDVHKTPVPARPSSTPPSNSDKEQKSPSTGLKRTLSEGHESDETPVKREGKRPKVEHEELEAKLELKITAKADSQQKLEKIVEQLVNERLKILELTIFDKNFQELKSRVDKIECASKHQSAISSLQAKISRLVKKFGEANQASEMKRKQEAIAAASSASSAAKTVSVTNTSQVQSVLRQQTVTPQPEVSSEGRAPSLGITPVLSVKVEREEQEMGEETEQDIARHTAMAKKLAEYSEGRCRPDVKLRKISPKLENVLYNNCHRHSGIPRPDRYASYIFRYLVPYEIYCDWVSKVNYVGLMGKEALPRNVRKTIRMYIDRRFPFLSTDRWREVRDVINEILRVKRRPDFFREFDGHSSMLY